jgi:hypothetical protein
MRRVEHTPLPRFLVIIIGTEAIMATGAFGVVVNLRKVPDRGDKLGSLNADVHSSERAAASYDELLDSIADTQNRKKAIAELWRTRIQWSKRLTQVAKIMPSWGGLEQMKLSEARGGARRGEDENGGLLTMDMRTATDDHSRVAWVRRAFRGEVRVQGHDPWVGREFFDVFQDIAPTRTEKVEEKDYVEKVALEFALNIPLKTAEERLEQAQKDARERSRARRRTGATVQPASMKRPAPAGTDDGTDGASPTQPEANTDAADDTSSRNGG